MKSVFYLLKELKFEILKIIIMDSFLDSMLIFLGVYLLLILMNLYPFYIALLVFWALLIYFTYSRFKKFKLKTVEDKNPDVREILRTAADNINEENFVVHQLHIELVKKMKNVASSTFVRLNHVAYKITGIIAISFLIVFLSANNIYIVDMNKALSNMVIPFRAISEESFSDDIFGEEDIAGLGDEEVEFVLNPLNYEINIEKVKDPEDRENKKQGEFPDISVTPEAAYEKKISRENQLIVKNYFNKIRK